MDVPAMKPYELLMKILEILQRRTCEPKCEGVTRSRTTVGATAIRITHPKVTRSKLACVSTPTTGVENRGAFIVHDNIFSNIDDRVVIFCSHSQVAYRDRMVSVRKICGLKPRFITGASVVAHPELGSTVELHSPSRLVTINVFNADERNRRP